MRLLLLAMCGCLLHLAAVEWPATVRADGADLALRGTGRLTWLWYKVYDVALHLPADAGRAQALDDRPRRLAFRYLRDFSAGDLAKATSRTVAAEGPAAAEIAAGVAAINALWPAVVAGDELQLLYRPGHGTTVTLNGRELGSVPGPDFARAMFAVWLGPAPVDEDLRDALLGR